MVLLTAFHGGAVENHSRGDGAVAQAIDDDEGAGRPIAAIAVEADWLVEGDCAAADLVELERRDILAVERVDVDLITERADGAGSEFAGLLEPVGFARNHRLFRHPDDGRLELLLNPRHVAGAHDHNATADVNFIFERQRDGLRRKSFFQVAVERDD